LIGLWVKREDLKEVKVQEDHHQEVHQAHALHQAQVNHHHHNQVVVEAVVEVVQVEEEVVQERDQDLDQDQEVESQANASASLQEENHQKEENQESHMICGVMKSIKMNLMNNQLELLS